MKSLKVSLTTVDTPPLNPFLNYFAPLSIYFSELDTHNISIKLQGKTERLNIYFDYIDRALPKMVLNSITSPVVITFDYYESKIKCTVKEVNGDIDYIYINVDTKDILLDYLGSAVTIPVQANTVWVVSPKDNFVEWLQIEYTGDRDGTATFYATKNKSLDRETTIVFTDLNREIIIERILRQEGLREVFSSDFRLRGGGTFNVLKKR